MEATQRTPIDEQTDDSLPTAAKLLTWFSDSYRAHEANRGNIVESLKFLNNDQWPDAIRSLLPPNMSPIVINEMLMPILYLCGVQRQTRQEAKLLPFEATDIAPTEIMNALLHWTNQQGQGDQEDSAVFMDKIALGMGFWKCGVDFNHPTDLEGKLWKRRRHPLAIFPDPNWPDCKWDEISYVIDTEWMTLEDAMAKWPEEEEAFRRQPGEWMKAATTSLSASSSASGEYAGDTLAAERLFWDDKAKRIRIVEAWYKQRMQVKLLMNMQSGEVEDDQQVVAAVQQRWKSLSPGEQANLQIIERQETMVRVAHLFADRKLDDDVSPFETDTPMFPIFPALGFYFWKNPFGMAELMKPLQLEKNKRRSKLIDLVGRMPTSGFFNHLTEGADQVQLENHANGNGVNVGYKSIIPTPIKPPDLPMALVRLEDQASAEIKSVTNINNELLGQSTQKTISGRAIEARQRGGLISHEYLFDSFRGEVLQTALFQVAMIKQFVSPTKALRILGAIAVRPGAAPPMQGMMQQAQNDGGQAVLEALSSAYDMDFDAVMDSRPTEPSLAMQAWETLVELQQGGAPIPPQVLFGAAGKAGILSEDQVQQILQYIQQQQMAQQQAAQPPPAPGPGQSPGPGASASSEPAAAAAPTAPA